MNRKKLIATSYALEVSLSSLVIIINFLSIPIYLTFVSINTYGTWLAIAGFVGLLMTVEPGAWLHLIKVLADPKQVKGESISQSYFANCFFIQFLCSVLLLVSGFVCFYFTRDEILSSDVTLTFAALIVAFCYSVVCNSYRAILASRRNLVTINIVSNGINLSAVVFTFCLLKSGYGLRSFGLGFLLATIIFETSLVWITKWRFPQYTFSLKLISKTRILEIFDYCKHYFGIRFAEQIKINYPRVLLGFMGTPALNTILSVHSKIPEIFPSYISKLAFSLFPSVSEVTDDIEKQQKIFLALVKILTRAGIFVGVCVVFMTEGFLRVWLGEHYFYGHVLLLLLAGILQIRLLTSGLLVFAMAKGNFSKLSVVFLGETFCAVILGWILFQKFQLKGLILALFLCGTISCGYLVRDCLKDLKINVRNFLKEIFRYTFYPCILHVFLISILAANFNLASWTKLSFTGIVLILSQFLFFEGLVFLKSSKNLKFRPRVQQAFLAKLWS